MSDTQKAAFFIMSGLIMLMGVVGGIEASPDLFTYDGVYLFTFALVGFALMALGVSYTNEVDA